MNDTITRPVMEAIDIDETTTILTASTDEYIYVRQLLLIADGGDNVVSINTVSGEGEGEETTTVSIVPLKADTGFTLENTAPDYPFLFDVKPGQSLSFDLSNATSVKGHIIYGYRK